MSTKPDGTEPEFKADQTAARSQDGQDGSASLEKSVEDDPLNKQQDIIAELEHQKADLTDRLLRAHAEMENFRKRIEREKADLAKFAISKFALDMVSVGDNFERAITAVPAGAAAEGGTLKSLLDGVTMTERAFVQALERHGVRRVEPRGEQFDPHLHQAVMEQDDVSVTAGTILQVFQAGYVIEERVLRPAMVVVAKGGPKHAPPVSPADRTEPPEQPPEPDPQQRN